MEPTLLVVRFVWNHQVEKQDQSHGRVVVVEMGEDVALLDDLSILMIVVMNVVNVDIMLMIVQIKEAVVVVGEDPIQEARVETEYDVIVPQGAEVGAKTDGVKVPHEAGLQLDQDQDHLQTTRIHILNAILEEVSLRFISFVSEKTSYVVSL